MEDQEYYEIWEYLKTIPILIDNSINHELYFMTPYWDNDNSTKYVFSSRLTDKPKIWSIHVMDMGSGNDDEVCLSYNANLGQIKKFIELIQTFE